MNACKIVNMLVGIIKGRGRETNKEVRAWATTAFIS